MATSLSAAVRYIPWLANANCYLFALAPNIQTGGYARRPHKAQPGEKCHGGNVPPLPFHEPETMRTELIRRVTCDNPGRVRLVPSPYDPSVLTRARSGEGRGRRHLMACIYGPSDFHFLRRMYLRTVLRSLDRLQPMTDAQLAELRHAHENGVKFIWAHQRGWMPPAADGSVRTRTRLRGRLGINKDGFGSPTVFDAAGRPCWSPVPVGAVEADPRAGVFTQEPPQSYFKYAGLEYNRFCGLFVVDSRRATVYSGRNTPMNTSKMSARNRQSVGAATRRRVLAGARRRALSRPRRVPGAGWRVSAS